MSTYEFWTDGVVSFLAWTIQRTTKLLETNHPFDNFDNILHYYRVELPPVPDNVRDITPKDVTRILETMPNYTFEMEYDKSNERFKIQVEDKIRGINYKRFTRISVYNLSGKITEPIDGVEFYGGELFVVLYVVRELTKICGHLVLFVSTGAPPLIVYPDTDIDAARLDWDIVTPDQVCYKQHNLGF